MMRGVAGDEVGPTDCRVEGTRGGGGGGVEEQDEEDIICSKG